MPENHAPPEAIYTAFMEHRGGLVDGGRSNTRHRLHCFEAGYLAAIEAATKVARADSGVTEPDGCELDCGLHIAAAIAKLAGKEE